MELIEVWELLSPDDRLLPTCISFHTVTTIKGKIRVFLLEIDRIQILLNNSFKLAIHLSTNFIWHA